MENFNTVPNKGTFGDSVAVVNENFMLAQQEMETLRQAYNSLSQSKAIPVTQLPATGEAGKIYRLAGTNSYADYMWNGNQFIKMAEYNNAIDDEPIPESNNLVKSGGVFWGFNKLAFEPFKDNVYGNESGNYTNDDDWYMSPLIPIKQNDRIVLNVPVDINSQSSQKALCYDASLNNFDYYSLANRSIVSDGSFAYLGISTRKIDADKFKVYVNGVCQYVGVPSGILENTFPSRIEKLKKELERFKFQELILDYGEYFNADNTLKQIQVPDFEYYNGSGFIFVPAQSVNYNFTERKVYALSLNTSTRTLSTIQWPVVADNVNNIIAIIQRYGDCVIDFYGSGKNEFWRIDGKINNYLTADVLMADSYITGSSGISRIVTDNNWYVGGLVPIELNDKITSMVPSDLLTTSPQKIGWFDENKNLIDYTSMLDERTVINNDSRCKFVAMSTRKSDSCDFKLLINNTCKYAGKPFDENNITPLRKELNEITGTDIYSKNRTKIDLLRAASNNGRRLQFLMATDAHEDFTALQNAVDFANKCSYIDALLLTGDNCGQAFATLSTLQQYNAIANRCTKTVLSIPGNHDVGLDRRVRYTTTDDKVLEYITEPTLQYLANGEHNSGKTYFFHDFTSKKVRVICLSEYDETISLATNQYWEPVAYNSSYPTYELDHEYEVNNYVRFELYTDYSFRCKEAHTSSTNNEIRTNEYRGYRFIGETQANWLVSTMLNTPAGFGIVISSHVPASNNFSTQYRNNKFCSKYLTDNVGFNAMGIDMLGILADAFNKGLSSSMIVKATGNFDYMNSQTIDGEQCAYKLSYNFASKNENTKFLVFLCGHTHVDLIAKNSQNIYCITPTFTTAITRQYDDNDCPRSGNDNDIARDALTAIAIDLEHDGVILTRVGTTSTTDGYLRDVDRLDLTQ